MNRFYKKAAVKLFGRFAEIDAFQRLKPDLKASGTKMLPKTYASVTLLTAVLAYTIALAAILITFSFVHLAPLAVILFALTIPFFAGFSAFASFYYYPGQKAKSVKKSIENDLPFAMSHMSAIASAGIPPEHMFDLLTGFKEYKNIANHASLIVRNIKTFGMSSVSAISSVAESTPSPLFKQILNGITFNIEKGGDLTEYMKGMAEKNLFDYKIKREKYLKTLSTYADIYTALLVAAPLMMLSILGILGVIGGEIMGLTINELIFVLTFIVLPGLNVAFLTFLQLTYPGT